MFVTVPLGGLAGVKRKSEYIHMVHSLTLGPPLQRVNFLFFWGVYDDEQLLIGLLLVSSGNKQ
jgi:hypothetical protein